MKSKQVFHDYCTGCGLCKVALGLSFEEDEKGFLYPLLNQESEVFCSKVCPAGGNALANYQDGSIWGKYRRSAFGWSADGFIRKGSSTGGVLTTLCIYLLEHHLVDGIIQTRRSNEDFRKTETIVSRTKEDVLSCMGSRYSTSSPLMFLNEMIQPGERYAFVGKPCDVSALRVYMEEVRPELKTSIIYLFSFFCAGQPSILANNQLVTALGGNNLNDCSDLQYRGNGWPGYATLTLKDGTRHQMDYETSWMKILGRNVRKCCRFCADGTGELADLACGDAWYLGDDGKPDFADRPGRNVIFARTETGDALLKDVEKAGFLKLEPFNPDRDGLRKIQPYHYTRKASLLVYKKALGLCGRIFPLYDNKKLSQFAKGFSVKQKILRFGGTIHRVIKGTI